MLFDQYTPTGEQLHRFIVRVMILCSTARRAVQEAALRIAQAVAGHETQELARSSRRRRAAASPSWRYTPSSDLTSLGLPEEPRERRPSQPRSRELSRPPPGFAFCRTSLSSFAGCVRLGGTNAITVVSGQRNSDPGQSGQQVGPSDDKPGDDMALVNARNAVRKAARAQRSAPVPGSGRPPRLHGRTACASVPSHLYVSKVDAACGGSSRRWRSTGTAAT
jgi:hypothetical protein